MVALAFYLGQNCKSGKSFAIRAQIFTQGINNSRFPKPTMPLFRVWGYTYYPNQSKNV